MIGRGRSKRVNLHRKHKGSARGGFASACRGKSFYGSACQSAGKIRLPRQRDPEAGQRVFRTGEARPPTQVLRDFVDKHRDTHGVEPICRVLQIAPSGYRRHAALRRHTGRRCARVQRDEALAPEIERVWKANMQIYGADKVWRQLGREGQPVARCTVDRCANAGCKE